MKHQIKLTVVIFSVLSSAVWADTCPTPPTSINPSVSTTVLFDKKSGFYSYQYAVKSGSDSQLPIDFFILQLGQAPNLIRSPNHWIGSFESLSYMPNNLSWMSSGEAQEVKPSQALNGFSIQSTQTPGVTLYNADGDTGVPASSPPVEGAADDEPQPSCPGWDFSNPRFQRLVNGITTGPLNPNTVSVAIRLRDESGVRPCEPIRPIGPIGKLSVLVLGTKSFDPSQVAVSSLKFGPNGAAPLSSRLVPAGSENVAPWDEHEEWERILSSLDPGWNKNPKAQNLLLIFDQAALGIQCVLDKALILTGKTQGGENIIGGVSTRLVGCDTRHPGVRPQKNK